MDFLGASWQFLILDFGTIGAVRGGQDGYPLGGRSMATCLLVVAPDTPSTGTEHHRKVALSISTIVHASGIQDVTDGSLYVDQ